MPENKKLGVRESFDLDLWQKIQDKFADSINSPIQTIDLDGNVVLESRELPFYHQMIQNKKKGFEKYTQDRINALKEIREKDMKLHAYYGHDGLLNIMVPITINNEIVGSVLASSIRNSDKNLSECRKTASEVGLESIELLDAIRDIRFRDAKEVEKIGIVLFTLSQTMPELVHGKKLSDRRISELTILTNVSRIVNSTLEIDKTMKVILNFMKSALNAENCSMWIFDDEKRTSLFEITEPYRYFEARLAEEVKLKEGLVAIKNVEEDPRFRGEEIVYKAVLMVPLVTQQKVLGVITLYSKEINLSEQDFQFISILSNQTALAINNSKQYEEIKRLAITDRLTELYNKRHFFDLLEMEINRAKQFKTYLSVIMIDADDFRNYNNTHGHPQGDVLLKELATILKDNMTPIDIVGRYGGEEFIIALPGLKPMQAKEKAEKIRKAIEETYFEGEESQPMGRVTISIGVATTLIPEITKEELIKIADKALYQAKANGKNCVVAVSVIDRNVDPLEI